MVCCPGSLTDEDDGPACTFNPDMLTRTEMERQYQATAVYDVQHFV